MLFTGTLAALALSNIVSAAIYPVSVPVAADGSGLFSGPQSGIGSWYRASASQDSTSGTGWCGIPYSNSDPVIAVYFTAMSANDATYYSDEAGWQAATRKYCGLAVSVKNRATGKSKLMYIGDAFDPAWVTRVGHPKGSLDVMVDGWSYLHGSSPNGNKNLVFTVDWELTGNINTQWAVSGASWPTRTGSQPSKTSSASASTATCSWGVSVPCRSPNVCTSGYCRAPASTCTWGCFGWDCSASVPCQSPNVCNGGYCKAPACSWGCTGWDCSASIPCQSPNTCVGGYCRESGSA